MEAPHIEEMDLAREIDRVLTHIDPFIALVENALMANNPALLGLNEGHAIGMLREAESVLCDIDRALVAFHEMPIRSCVCYTLLHTQASALIARSKFVEAVVEYNIHWRPTAPVKRPRRYEHASEHPSRNRRRLSEEPSAPSDQ